jgi:xanthine dehydrogenase accessory factor
LFRAGLEVTITELPEPLVVRRKVAFAEAVYLGSFQVEDVPGCLVQNFSESDACFNRRCIPVLVAPGVDQIGDYVSSIQPARPLVIVDARMNKTAPEAYPFKCDLLVGLGPGFTAGCNCDAVVETNRGHQMGRVIWRGSAQQDTGLPEVTSSESLRRVLRAPEDGSLVAFAEIGDHLEPGQQIARIGSAVLTSPFKAVLRGLLHPGVAVKKGMKIGDIDPRDDPTFCYLVSDKALAVGGGVLEAILSRPELRGALWG